MPGETKRESRRARAERARSVAARLREAHPDATCALRHDDAFQLLVATVLSAQCTDKRVNEVMPGLLARWPTPDLLAEAVPDELEQAVYATGFFRQKAKSLRGLAAGLRDDFGGEVPRSLEELIRLPGVARKTANVVLGTAFGIAEGVVVDTHVKRIAGARLGLSEATDPGRIEKDLMDLLPREEWIDFSHRMIWHGRRVCAARSPDCGACNLADLCPSAHRA